MEKKNEPPRDLIFLDENNNILPKKIIDDTPIDVEQQPIVKFPFKIKNVSNDVVTEVKFFVNDFDCRVEPAIIPKIEPNEEIPVTFIFEPSENRTEPLNCKVTYKYKKIIRAKVD